MGRDSDPQEPGRARTRKDKNHDWQKPGRAETEWRKPSSVNPDPQEPRVQEITHQKKPGNRLYGSGQVVFLGSCSPLLHKEHLAVYRQWPVIVRRVALQQIHCITNAVHRWNHLVFVLKAVLFGAIGFQLALNVL